MLPDEIYVPYETDSNYISKHYYLGPTPKMENAEYIRKDIADGMVESAEDHAYFAGQEKLREKLLEWAKENHKRMVEVHSDYTKIYDEYFRGLIEKIESL